MDPHLALDIASSAAGIFALCRLVSTRAHRSYPWFVIYLGASALQVLVWFGGGLNDRRYVIAWAMSTAILIALRIVIVVELWRKLMATARVESVSRSFTWVVLALAVAVSAASGLDSLPIFGVGSRRLAFYTISLASRYSGSALCVICSGLALFAIMLPRAVPRNALRHAFLLTAYFATIAAGFLTMNFVRGSAPIVGALMSGSAAGLYVLWGILLSEPGERVRSTAPISAQPELS